MKHKRSLCLAFAAMLIAILACSAPGGGGPAPDLTGTFSVALTAAFGTAQAGLPTAVTPGGDGAAPVTPPPGVTLIAPPTPTAQPTIVQVKPTDTPAPTNTPGVQGCSDGSEYVTDVTIPDNTVFAPGQAFTKTWRLKNSGTCTWVSAYSLAFAGGDQMGGPASVAISGNVAPGSLYEVSVNLVAPATPGTYKGSWRLKNATGSFFGTTPFVQIVVAAPTATATNTSAPPTPTATFTPVPPTATATNTTAPAVVFTAGYAGYWFCGTQPRVNFQVINTGSVTIESMNIRVEGPIGTYLNGNTQNSPFRSSPTQPSPDCVQAGSESLAPGSAAWVNTNVPSIPAGSSGRGVIKLCSQNDLGGSCMEVTVDFTY